MRVSKQHTLFPFFIVLMLSLPLTFIEKADFIFFINSQRNLFLDYLFINITILGDGFIVPFCFFCVLFLRFKWVVIFLVALALQVVAVYVFKQHLFHGELRPYLFFKYADELCNLELVEGIKMRYVNTFPSGHTATAFFLASYFSVVIRQRVLVWLLVMVAFAVGISRAYLLLHFFNDVFFGMLFGVFSTFIAVQVIHAKPKNWHDLKVKINLGVAKRVKHAAMNLFF